LSDRARTPAPELIGRRALLASLGIASAEAMHRLVLDPILRTGTAATRAVLEGAMESGVPERQPAGPPGSPRTQEGP
jgi:hypothetical protein